MAFTFRNPSIKVTQFGFESVTLGILLRALLLCILKLFRCEGDLLHAFTQSTQMLHLAASFRTFFVTLFFSRETFARNRLRLFGSGSLLFAFGVSSFRLVLFVTPLLDRTLQVQKLLRFPCSSCPFPRDLDCSLLALNCREWSFSRRSETERIASRQRVIPLKQGSLTVENANG